MIPLDEKLGSARRRSVLSEIKRSSGLTVRQLAERLGLSYMGIKQHCVALEKKGYLQSRNLHNGIGRPLRVYRVTEKTGRVFEAPGPALALHLLRSAREMYGPQAPSKLLFRYFQALGDDYIHRLTGLEGGDRLGKLAALREESGHMAVVNGEVLVEYHRPNAGIFSEFPDAGSMEESMISRVLGWNVRREEHREAGGVETRFIPLAGLSCGETPE